ncbi:hypothetical protein BMS3Abin04_02560 [bacterium BMS3Abin04]|nr:hypothetical protein BMS3Abin04_02560 [bacterium BMS3Abin04]
MITKRKIYYLAPVLLGVFIFASDFVGTNLFSGEATNFSVWFVLSLFAFACGWIINLTLNWEHGGKIVFAVIIATTIVSIGMISFFNDYFGPNELLSESLILYSLRNITLGLMGVFGMAVSNVILLERENDSLKIKDSNNAKSEENLNKETELILKESKIKAEGIILEAKKEASRIIDTKNNIEKELKELIQIEKDLIKKYEGRE